MSTKRKKIGLGIASYATLIVVAIFAASLTFVLYDQTKSLLEDRLKEKVTAIVATAALQFAPSDLDAVKDENDVGTPPFFRMVDELQSIRNANSNIYYAYIFRPTNNRNIFKYIVDADSRDPNAKIDLNHDGTIDDSDALNWPGDEYDASDVPALVDDAVNFATTDSEPIKADAYGTFLSAYAPIKERGKTVAILVIDVEVSDYLKKVTQTFVPFLLFVFFLLGILTLLTRMLIRLWGNQVILLEELDRQKDELLSIVSHQLATPVSSVKWYLEMLLDGDVGVLSKEQQEYLNTMQSVTYNLADLVSMILDVSRIQLGKMKVDLQPLDLNEFFKEILSVIEPKAQEKQQNFDVHIPKDLPTVMLDRRLTRMTVENLLSNAVKYTPAKGSVAWNVERHGDMLSLTVQDTGCGIPEKDQKKIFGKLFRASNTGSIDGNGFGLYVAKGAIEAQGGKIWFESKQNKGTKFFVQLPIKLVQN